LEDHADRIQKAVLKTIAEGQFRTGDLGGKATNSAFTEAVIRNLFKKIHIRGDRHAS
ncbi:NAD-dependent isocitrate dehydrogenase, partial [Chytriomyces hyalinus]